MRHVLAAVVTLVATATLFAAAPGTAVKPPQTLMAQPGKLIFADDFASGELKPTWAAAKGKWVIEDGVLKGTELAADKHAASIRHPLAFQNAVIQFDFKLTSGKATHLSLNHAKGHLARVTITPDGFTMRRDADKKTKEKAVLLDTVKHAFEPGKWYTMTVEMIGDEMVAHLDGKHIGYGRHAGLDMPRANFGFPSSGEATYFDNVRIWEATAKSDWPALRETLAGRRTAAAR